MPEPKSILIIVTSHGLMADGKPTGLWFEEFAVPYDLFRRQDYAVTVASPKGGKIPLDPKSLEQKEKTDEHQGAFEALQDTRALSDLNPDDYDAVFFPGGHGTMYDLPEAPAVGATLVRFFETGKPVAAVCHGPAALVGVHGADGAPIVKGRRLTAFTNEEEHVVELQDQVPFLLESRLRELGGEFAPAPAWSDHVVVDGHLITGQNPQSSASTAKAVIDALSK